MELSIVQLVLIAVVGMLIALTFRKQKADMSVIVSIGI